MQPRRILIVPSTKRCRSCVADVQESDPVLVDEDWKAQRRNDYEDEEGDVEDDDDVTNFHENVCQCVHSAMDQR